MKYFLFILILTIFNCENHRELFIPEKDMKIFLEGNISKTEKLLEKYDINAIDLKGNTIILRHFIENRDESYLKYYKYLINKKIDINKPNKINTTLLSYSCEYNKTEIIKWLFENNVDTKTNDDFGNSVIYRCIFYIRDVTVLDLFFKNKNIDIHKEENEQNSLFKTALLTHDKNVIEYFLQKTDMKTVVNLYFKEIAEYVDNSSIEDTKYFLDKIEDINITNGRGYNLLYYAMDYFNTDLIEYLIEKRNININEINYSKRTVLDYVTNMKFYIKNEETETVKSVLHKEEQKQKIINYLKSKGAKRGCELRSEKCE